MGKRGGLGDCWSIGSWGGVRRGKMRCWIYRKGFFGLNGDRDFGETGTV